MRIILVAISLIAAPPCFTADDAPKASRMVEGKSLPFDPKGVAEGVKTALAMLESCCSDEYGPKELTAADMEKALKADHVRVVFPKPVTVNSMNKKIEISELVFDGGAFLLLSGDKVLRRTKYTYEKSKPFEQWQRSYPPRE